MEKFESWFLQKMKWFFTWFVVSLFVLSLVDLVTIGCESYPTHSLSFSYKGFEGLYEIFVPHAGVFGLTFTLVGILIAFGQLKESNKQNRISVALSNHNLRTLHFYKMLEKYEPYNKNLHMYFVLNYYGKISDYILDHKTANNAKELEKHFKALFEGVGSFIDKGDIFIQNQGAIYLNKLDEPISAPMLYNIFRVLVDVLKYEDAEVNHPQVVFNRLYLRCIDESDYCKYDDKTQFDIDKDRKSAQFKDFLNSEGFDYKVYKS